MSSTIGTKYAKSDGCDIAYQVIGNGQFDLLLLSGALIPFECMDDEPSLARFQRRIASFCRLIRFDRRGTGLSDRGNPSAPPTVAQWVQDGIAVLDAAGSPSASVLAPFTDAVIGIAMAVAHPARVTSLVIVNGSAFPASAFEAPGEEQEQMDLWLNRYTEPDALELGHDLLTALAPSVAGNKTFRAWWDRAGNLGASPEMARAVRNAPLAEDLRGELSNVSVPTLVIQRINTKLWNADNGRQLADNIAGSKYVELPGDDSIYWVGDSGPMLDEIEEFLTGQRASASSERILATVLFTDIVGSTDLAAQFGDARWRDVLDGHDQAVRQHLRMFRGREVKATGDGFVATFDSPGRAIECAQSIRESLRAMGLVNRAGIHTGELEIRGEDVAGMSVHLCARVAALAGPGEVVVSSTVKDILIGSAIRFTDRGEHELKGVPGSWRLFLVEE
jgi:class 3 adenylate cyclase/pimeloyl-ACP methyl ester carboxylesterase